MGTFRVEKHFGGKCLKKGHWKFGVPGNVILQKSPANMKKTTRHRKRELQGIERGYMHSNKRIHLHYAL